MIFYDPESFTMINSNGVIVQNCKGKRISDYDRNVLTCEWDGNADHNQLLLLAELFFGQRFPRFIDLARRILGQDTIYLREWERVKDDIANTDYDRHQALGRKRVETMKHCVLKFIKILPEQRVIKLSASLSRLAVTKQKPFDFVLDFASAEPDMLDRYLTVAKIDTPEALDLVASHTLRDRGYIQNWWGRRLYHNGVPPAKRIPALTENKTDTVLGWLVNSSLHDTAVFVADYLYRLLEPKNGSAFANYQCVKVTRGQDVTLPIVFESFAANPDIIFKDKPLNVVYKE